VYLVEEKGREGMDENFWMVNEMGYLWPRIVDE
jgi:hypothetical protein